MTDVLQYDEAQHAVSVPGRVVPSVTQILQPIDELDGIPLAMLQAAAQFGRHVHKAIYLHSVGNLNEPLLDAHLVPYLKGWKQFLYDTKAVVQCSERKVHHRQLRYAGTLDSVLIWKGRKVCDVKSSVGIPRSVGPQLAAYRQAYMLENPEHHISRTRLCVHLKPDGTYRVQELKDDRDWSIFVSLLNLYRWRNG